MTYGRGASAMGRTDWASLLRAWLRAAWPQAGHELHNGAVAASPSEYMSFCVQVGGCSRRGGRQQQRG